MAKLGAYKFTGADDMTAHQLAEILKKHLDPKFQITAGLADKGIKKFVTGITNDTVVIKKNAYHGVIITPQPKSDAVPYRTLWAQVITPSFMLDQIVGHTGILDLAICNLIFGKGDDLYDKLEEVLQNELGMVWVDTGVVNSVKNMLKGKNVFDEAK